MGDHGGRAELFVQLEGHLMAALAAPIQNEGSSQLRLSEAS